ncbi:MAG: hypothetical protein ACKOOG_02130, partial [Actinomycetota bacterium]
MRLATLAATLTAVTGLMVPTPAGADGDNTCKFSIFPTAPGGTSELTIGCFLTTLRVTPMVTVIGPAGVTPPAA